MSIIQLFASDSYQANISRLLAEEPYKALNWLPPCVILHAATTLQLQHNAHQPAQHMHLQALPSMACICARYQIAMPNQLQRHLSMGQDTLLCKAIMWLNCCCPLLDCCSAPACVGSLCP